MIRQSCIMLCALGLLAGPALAQAPAAKKECFQVRELDNWKPGANDKTMNIRVAGNRFYRLDLANRCQDLTWPGAFLVNTFRSSFVCSALDWDIKVSLGAGSIPMACMVRQMTRLSPTEVAALPPRQKP